MMTTRVIDVIDFKGHEWSLLVPPLKWNRPKTELWLLVANDSQPEGMRMFAEIPVPCFTDWWYEMSAERYREVTKSEDAVLTLVEFTAGWHFCWDWDGMLVNAYDTEGEGEGSACTCYRRVT